MVLVLTYPLCFLIIILIRQTKLILRIDFWILIDIEFNKETPKKKERVGGRSKREEEKFIYFYKTYIELIKIFISPSNQYFSLHLIKYLCSIEFNFSYILSDIRGTSVLDPNWFHELKETSSMINQKSHPCRMVKIRE